MKLVFMMVAFVATPLCASQTLIYSSLQASPKKKFSMVSEITKPNTYLYWASSLNPEKYEAAVCVCERIYGENYSTLTFKERRKFSEQYESGLHDEYHDPDCSLTCLHVIRYLFDNSLYLLSSAKSEKLKAE